MKKTTILIVLCSFFLHPIVAQEADKILGYWLTQEGDSQIKIFKAKNGKYYGNIKWLKDPYEEDGTPKVDKHNPDEEKKKNPVMNLQLLKGFSFNADDNEWQGGTIYDPKNGKTYKCYIWFEDGDGKTLHVKGFIGISIIGREVEWIREEKLREIS